MGGKGEGKGYVERGAEGDGEKREWIECDYIVLL